MSCSGAWSRCCRPIRRWERRPWARAPLLVDSRHNAPAGATQVNADHVLAGLPVWVDFCVFPVSRTPWPVGHRVIFERRRIPAGDMTLDALTSAEPRQAAKVKTSAERRQAYLAFVPLTAKYIVRGQPAHVRDMIRFIGDLPGYDETGPRQQLLALRAIAASLSAPRWTWLASAVTTYLDLIGRALG